MAEDYQAALVASVIAAMEAKGWGFKELADALGYDDQVTVKRWLRRQVAISLTSRARIAAVLGTTPTAIDPKNEAYDPANRPPHMRRGGNRHGLRGFESAADEMNRRMRARPPADSDIDADRAYLIAMEAWWQELTPDQREQVHDFARKLRDAQREARKQKAG